MEMIPRGPAIHGSSPTCCSGPPPMNLMLPRCCGKRTDARVAIHGLGRTGQLLADPRLRRSGLTVALRSPADDGRRFGSRYHRHRQLGTNACPGPDAGLAQAYPRRGPWPKPRCVDQRPHLLALQWSLRGACCRHWRICPRMSGCCRCCSLIPGVHRAHGHTGIHDVRALRMGTMRSNAADRGSR